MGAFFGRIKRKEDNPDEQSVQIINLLYDLRRGLEREAGQRVYLSIPEFLSRRWREMHSVFF
jgi:hypothetical protein